MNLQGIGEIFLEETCSVPPEQTARALFARLPHGSDYAENPIEWLATGYLVAVVESICIREMQRHVDAASEVVVGRTVQIEHKAPIPPGSSLKLRGRVERLGERSATFCVQACDDHEVVCENSITLVAALRASMESRIADKVNALRVERSCACCAGSFLKMPSSPPIRRAGCQERRQFTNRPSTLPGAVHAETGQTYADAVGHSSLLMWN